MGMFGGLGRALSKPASGDGLSLLDRIAIFGTAASGDFGTAMQLRQLPAQRSQQQAAQAWRANLFGGQGASSGPVTNGEGEDISAAFAPPVQARRGLPSLRDIAPQLINAPPGVDIRPIMDILKATAPKGMNVNGRVLDENDPASIGMEVPEVDKGQVRLYDAQGRFAGVRNADGYVRSVADLEGAKTGAQEAAKAPYTFPTFQGPGGRPITVSGATAAALGGNGGIIATGQSPAEASAEKIRADAEATRQTDLPAKMSGYASQLQALDAMEGFLPDVVSGFGADIKLQALRAAAATGNEDAQKKVVATETFLNQGRVLVSNIIKTFGANPTEGERKYAERMSGADAQLNPETLREGIRLQRQRINRDMIGAQQPVDRPPASGGASMAAPSRSAVEAELRRRGLLR